MTRWLLTAGLAAAALLSACGGAVERQPEVGDQEGAAPAGGNPGGAQGQVSCHAAGDRFPAAALEGPVVAPRELAREPTGAALVEFFTSGPGTAESRAFDRAEGFIVLTESAERARVAGMSGARMTAEFSLERESGGWRVDGWGGCEPRRVDGERVAARWVAFPEEIAADARRVELEVQGGKCGDRVTRIVDTEVVGDPEAVTVTVWTRDPDCPAGVGATVATTVELDRALGDRQLLDGGVVPPQPVCETALGRQRCPRPQRDVPGIMASNLLREDADRGAWVAADREELEARWRRLGLDSSRTSLLPADASAVVANLGIRCNREPVLEEVTRESGRLTIALELLPTGDPCDGHTVTWSLTVAVADDELPPIGDGQSRVEFVVGETVVCTTDPDHVCGR